MHKNHALSGFNLSLLSGVLGMALLATGVHAAAPPVTVLHAFDNTDGRMPASRLVEGADGNLYGTTWLGGANDCGTIFRITPEGVLTTLHALASATDGCQPRSGLIRGSDDHFCGVAVLGGPLALGTVFRITAAGVFTRLHAFGGASSPAGPEGRLLEGSDGRLYGTTTVGGSVASGESTISGNGTIYRMSMTGADFEVLHTFSLLDEANGYFPAAGLVEATDGHLYGTTELGGAGCSTCGTVFRIAPDGTGFATVHTFAGANGRGPSGELVAGEDDKLYGMTGLGGQGDPGFGTLFRIDPTPAADFERLHAFDNTDLMTVPQGGLSLASDGNLYGTANSVFRLTPQGSVTALYSLLDIIALPASDQPLNPMAGVTMAANGSLYGTSSAGGIDAPGCAVSCGTVFRVVAASGGGNTGGNNTGGTGTTGGGGGGGSLGAMSLGLLTLALLLLLMSRRQAAIHRA